jgi:hypothetical protein
MNLFSIITKNDVIIVNDCYVYYPEGYLKGMCFDENNIIFENNINFDEKKPPFGFLWENRK